MKKLISNVELYIGDYLFQTEIIKELRFDTRFSITKEKLIIRLPSFFSKSQTNNNIESAKKWVSAQIREGNFKSFIAKLDKNVIYISIPYGVSQLEKQNAISYLQSRVIGKFFMKEIENRIEELNKKYFNVNIADIKLKYNKSNWGSRSAKNNINISTRLLFAPRDVQDYVFIHELAHFKEMNHSRKFWAIVEKIMPDYKQKEKWLKDNSEKCDF